VTWCCGPRAGVTARFGCGGGTAGAGLVVVADRCGDQNWRHDVDERRAIGVMSRAEFMCGGPVLAEAMECSVKEWCQRGPWRGMLSMDACAMVIVECSAFRSAWSSTVKFRRASRDLQGQPGTAAYLYGAARLVLRPGEGRHCLAAAC